MYIAVDFEVTDEDALYSVIDQFGLATLVSAAEGVPAATLAPFVFSRENVSASFKRWSNGPTTGRGDGRNPSRTPP
jgi:predicted FMN-binding regulatory protein PaiB